MMDPISLRMRPEIALRAQGGRDGYWLLEDPVSLRYFRLKDEEWFILKLLDGKTSLDQIKQRFEREFAPLRLGMQQLQGFLFQLHELGLVVGDATGQGNVLFERRTRGKFQAIAQAVTNPLAITLPGWGARRFIEWLYPHARWVFHPVALVGWIALVLCSAALVLLEFGIFRSRLPTMQDFFSPGTVVWFAIALVVTKALHELGHALTCRHFGGTCREIGVMFLVFIPTLFCDVSDSWRLRSKRQRIAVSAAGMLVECVVASMATWIWWWSDAGVVNAIALRVMFLCSISTLCFNANPLVRCDGYYILSDAIEVPNLWQESRARLRRLGAQWLTGRIGARSPGSEKMTGWLAAYAFLSVMYCTGLILGVLWLALRTLEPMGLRSLGWILSVVTIAAMVYQPARSFVSEVRRSSGRGRVPWGLRLRLLVIAGLLGLVSLIPLPHRVAAVLLIEPHEASPIYVTAAGLIDSTVTAGTRVDRGAVIAKLKDEELESQVADLKAQVEQIESHLVNLRRMAADDKSVGPTIVVEEKALEDAKKRLEIRLGDRNKLVITAPVPGFVIAPPSRSPPSNLDGDPLAGWHGTPLDAHNVGAFLEVGDIVCSVGDPQRLDATLFIEQNEIGKLKTGQVVTIRIQQAPRHRFTGTLVRLARDELDQRDPEALQGLGLPLRSDPGSPPRLAGVYYRATVEFDAGESRLLPGMTGDARITVAPRTLMVQFIDAIRQTFRGI